MKNLASTLYYMLFGLSDLPYQKLEEGAYNGGLMLNPKFTIANWIKMVMNRGSIVASRLQVPVICKEKGHEILIEANYLKDGCPKCHKWTNERVTQLILQKAFGGDWNKKKMSKWVPNAPEQVDMEINRMGYDYGEAFTIEELFDHLKKEGYIKRDPFIGVHSISCEKKGVLFSPTLESDGKQHELSGEGFFTLLGIVARRDKDVAKLLSSLNDQQREEIIKNFPKPKELKKIIIEDINDKLFSFLKTYGDEILLREYKNWKAYMKRDFFKNYAIEKYTNPNMNKFITRIPIYDDFDVFKDIRCRKRIDLIFAEINKQLKEVLGDDFDLHHYGLDYSALFDIDWLSRARNF